MAAFSGEENGGSDKLEDSQNLTQGETLARYWENFSKDEKRLIIAHLTDKIVVGKSNIEIEFALASDSLQTIVVEQQRDVLTKGQQDQASEQTDLSVETSTESNTNEPNISLSSAQFAPPSLNESLLNESQAARFLGISRMTLIRKRNAGEIKFFRVGTACCIQRKNISRRLWRSAKKSAWEMTQKQKNYGRFRRDR